LEPNINNSPLIKELDDFVGKHMEDFNVGNVLYTIMKQAIDNQKKREHGA
jgi:hypothetical protein